MKVREKPALPCKYRFVDSESGDFIWVDGLVIGWGDTFCNVGTGQYPVAIVMDGDEGCLRVVNVEKVKIEGSPD